MQMKATEYENFPVILFVFEFVHQVKTDAKLRVFLQEGQGRSQILVKAVDDYGLGVAATLNGSTKSRSVRTNNLVIKIDRVDQNSPVRQS